MPSKQLLTSKHIQVIIDRLCYQLIEQHSNFSETALVGLQPRGIYLAQRIHQRTKEILGHNGILLGALDIAFYRDDYRRHDEPIIPSELNINFPIEDKDIVIIDDVLYTGRSVRSALDALTDFGRPRKVELMVLIDRRYSRQLPIEPDYVGKTVDTRSNEKVIVSWAEQGQDDGVVLITNQKGEDEQA